MTRPRVGSRGTLSSRRGGIGALQMSTQAAEVSDWRRAAILGANPSDLPRGRPWLREATSAPPLYLILTTARGNSPRGCSAISVLFERADEGDRAPKGRRSRREILETGREIGSLRIQEITRWVEKCGLEAELGGIDRPSAFGAVVITASPKVASCVSDIPGVKAVLEDRDSLPLVR